MGDLVMKISRVEQQQTAYNIERDRIQRQQDENYRKVVEKRKFDQIVAERVRRNIRLDLDKGRHIDIET